MTTALDPSLVQWMMHCVQQGQSPEQMLHAMIAQGWQADVALQTIERGLAEHMGDLVVPQHLPKAVPVPQPITSNDRWQLDIDGHQVQVLASMVLPRVVVFGNLLRADECAELIEQAKGRLERSTTLNPETGEGDQVAERSSEGMFFQRGENALITRIEQRIATLLGWPVENGEGLQILRYGVGAEYRPHHDYFEPALKGSAETLSIAGQRVASLVMYLNTPEQGGATSFTDVDFEVGAVRGNAVFFSYDRPHPITRSRHAGSPVHAGEKWVATKWLRERPYVGKA